MFYLYAEAPCSGIVLTFCFYKFNFCKPFFFNIAARVILDRETGRSRGFGFITFTSTEAASSAIQAFDGQVLSSVFVNLPLRCIALSRILSSYLC